MSRTTAVVVSDIDGTLLASHDYAFDRALPALEILRERKIPVVLVSSKTRSEIEVLRKTLEIHDPFVVENGGAVYVPRGSFRSSVGEPDESGGYEVIRWGVPYEVLVGALREVRRQTGAPLRGYSDADVDEVRRRTGLSPEEARRSLEREFDEPFWVEGQDDERTREALERLTAKNLTVTRGGRFFHIMGGCDKGQAVREILRLYQASTGRVTSAGLGDAANDVAFLQVVDRPYLVARSDGRHDPTVLESVPRAIRVAPAPLGWAEAVTDFLSWLDNPLAPE